MYGTLSLEQMAGAAVQPDMRANLALHHLFAACRFAANVALAERDNAGRPLGAFWEEILHNALGVAALTVTFLDSYANDLCLEAGVRPGTADGDGILDKYSDALEVRTGRRLDPGAAPVRSVAALIGLRNEVVRLRSLTPEEGGDKLAGVIAGCFDLSPLFPGESVLPRAWASYSFVSWALESTIAFIDYVYAEAGLTSPIARFRGQLSEMCGQAVRRTAGREGQIH